MDEKNWVFRVMEIRKNPSCATTEEILKLADDFFYNLYLAKNTNKEQYIANLVQRLSADSLDKEC